MKTLFQKGFPKVYDSETVNELKTFIYTDSAMEKGAGAQTGYHDDRVMGMMLAFWDVPFVYQEENKEKEKFRSQFALKRNRQYLNSTK
jgi:hypothetical protein